MQHADINNQEFIHQIETVTINPELFTHEAHIRMAWLYLNDFDNDTALQHICAAIKGIDAKYAGGTKYHHTITVVFAHSIAILMQQKPVKTWQEFVVANTGIRISKKFLAEYYSDETLYSDEAKNQFVAPDKKLFV
jgi:hypothetical protein